MEMSFNSYGTQTFNANAYLSSFMLVLREWTYLSYLSIAVCCYLCMIRPIVSFGVLSLYKPISVSNITVTSMGAMASQIFSFTIVYSTVYSGTDRRKHQSAGNSPVIGEFPAQMASNGEFFFIWWRHHDHSQVNSMSSSLSLMSRTGLVAIVTNE